MLFIGIYYKTLKTDISRCILKFERPILVQGTPIIKFDGGASIPVPKNYSLLKKAYIPYDYT